MTRFVAYQLMGLFAGEGRGGDVAVDFLVGERIVHKVAGEIVVVGRHVDEAVAGEIEEDDFLFAGLFAFEGFAYGGGDGVAALGRRDDAFAAGEDGSGLEGFELVDVDGFHEFVFEELGDDDACAVVAETAGVDVGGPEVVAEGEHREQGSVAGFVAEVIFEDAACEFGARSGFGGDEAGFLGCAAVEIVAHEGEGDAAEVGAAAEAGNHHVGIFAGHGHLFLGFEADDGLVESHVAEHRAEGVFTSGSCGGEFHGLGDGGAERALMVGILGEDVLAGACRHGWRSGDLCAESLHDGTAVGLLLVGDFHLVDSGFEAEQTGGVGQGRTPLSGSGFGCDVGYTFLLTVVGLGDG